MEDYVIRECDLCNEVRHVYKHGTARWCRMCVEEEQRERLKDAQRGTKEKNKEV